MVYFAQEQRERYRQVLFGIGSSLGTMFTNYPPIHPKDLSGEGQVEYLTIVPQNGTNYGYYLYFIQESDGVWRLHSL